MSVSRTPKRRGRRKKRLHHKPFAIRRIAFVPHALTPILWSSDFGPDHRALLRIDPIRRNWLKSLSFFFRQTLPISGLLAPEVAEAGREAEDRPWPARPDPANVPVKLTVGCLPDPWRAFNAGIGNLPQSTVSKYMVRRGRPPSQNWKTFLRNHAGAIAAIDLCAVPVTFDQLYACVVVGHGRRQLLWFNVSRHPTAEWLARQMTEAFPWASAPTYLVRDNARAYGPFSPAGLRRWGSATGRSVQDRRCRTGWPSA